jgi:hypothetical protein
MENDAKLAAFCAAIDEGDASPDVADFDEDAFIAEMKEKGKTTKMSIVRELHKK